MPFERLSSSGGGIGSSSQAFDASLKGGREPIDDGKSLLISSLLAFGEVGGLLVNEVGEVLV